LKICSENYRSPSFNERGIALVIVLWMLALMTILALAYSGMTRTESLLSHNMIHSAQARAQAESGIWLAVNDLLKRVKSRQFPADSSPVVIHSTQTDNLTISIQDESGKIDLNKASQQLLLGLIKSAGIDHDQSTRLVDAILDWRDRDSLTRVNGAEDQQYESMGYPYGAKDGTFNSIGELMQIRGMTPSLYKKLKPLITVHSTQSRIRLNSAPSSVLNALPDMSVELMTRIMSGRSNNETAIIPSILPDSIRPLVFTSGQGNVYSVTSEATVKGITSRLRVTLVLKKSGNQPITILKWQENAPPLIQEPLQETL